MKNLKTNNALLIAVVMAIIAPMASFADASSPDSEQVEKAVEEQIVSEKSSEQDMETITVEGDDQLIVLRYNYVRAEDDFFNTFNNLTDNEDFHVTCEKKRQHSFTRIKKRQCESAYEPKIRSEAIQQFVRANPMGFGLPQSVIFARQREARMKQLAELEQKIEQSPLLQEKLLTLIDAKRKYNVARGAREDWGL